MTGFRATALHHFGLSVADLEDTVRWYRDKLGFAEEFRYEIAALDARVAFMALNDLRIEIFQLEGAAQMPDSSRHPATDLRIAGLKHVAIGVEDIEHAVTELTARGVAFLGEVATVPNSGGARYVFFKDNNGIPIELHQAAP